MTHPIASSSSERQSLLPAILVGGGVAGTLDIIFAIKTWGWGVPRGVASGLLGPRALHGGSGVWLLGLCLHFFVAYSVATIYCLSSLRLKFLKHHFIVCGLYYGVAVYIVMNLIVRPILFHGGGPYPLRSLIQGLLSHMLLIGMPIAISLWKFSNRTHPIPQQG